MNIKRFFSTIVCVAVVAISLSSCVKTDDWETPTVNCNNRFPEPNTTMAAFMAMAPASGPLLITQDTYFDGYVVSSDENGNFYKTISFQDSPTNPTVGLQMEIDRAGNYADFPVGAHIRINAKGLRLGLDRGVIKIGSVDPTFDIGRIPASIISRYISGVCNGNGLDLQKLVPRALTSLAEAKQSQYINTLVSVPNVQFATSDLGKKYLEYIAGTTTALDTDRNIEDNTGSSTIIRNSSFASFGSSIVPSGNGTIQFVVSRYISTWQMLIRDLNDVKIPVGGTRFDAAPPKGGTAITYSGAFTEDFESYSLTPSNLEVFPNYVNDAFLNNRYWQLKSFSNNKYIQLGANSGTGNYKTYFAVPVNFTAANTLKFNVNIGYWNGNALKVYTTTNYTALGDFGAATLTDITSSFVIPTVPTNGYGTLASAGTYNFPAALTGNGFVVFEYTGGNPGITTTIQIDNVVVN
ncbi:DUF5689 domain-containing protein [Frigoriflavimonas asaccharolytica]|uniref:DUF5689 domain-containing protein n=1 Tax=Frigoriflavimonas asaccharolytica TaxID=2735899 RepID=A0A8J8G728_9FLAO|nr:DUF5689 domain-containing protein [Frigoriflavimonas asaccharolytica]NRS92196.1 hypothetical protein [Frigoriflavimonas asaccharolytica]